MHAVVINSHAANAAALERLLESMRLCPEYDRADVVAVVGGHSDYEIAVQGSVTLVKAPHNSIDFTALIAMLDVPELQRPSFAYVHDTCEVGPRFLELLAAVPVPAGTASFPFPSMNMGVYSWAAIERARDALLAEKNPDLSPEAAARFKRRGVESEDLVFLAEQAAGRHDFSLGDADPARETVTDVYGTGVPRRTRYFPALDLYKSQANWGQNFGNLELRL